MHSSETNSWVVGLTAEDSHTETSTVKASSLNQIPCNVYIPSGTKILSHRAYSWRFTCRDFTSRCILITSDPLQCMKYEFQWNKSINSSETKILCLRAYSQRFTYKDLTSSSRSILTTSDPLQCISSQWNKNLESQGSPFLLSLRGSQALSSGFLRVCIPSLYFWEDVASNIIQTEFKFSILCPNILQSTGYIDIEGREEISLV